MSGFTATNSRITVVETVGTAPNEIDEIVFDTNDDMPHIVGTAYLTNITVDFNNLTETQNYIGQECVATYTRDTVLVYNPGVWFNYTVYHPGVWDLGYNFTYNQYQRTYTPSFTTWERDYTPSFYSWDWVFVYDICGTYQPYYEYSIDANEYNNVTNLTNLPTDEDGNAVSVDFIIVQATGTRTLDGYDPRFNQMLPTTVPSKTFSFQGSVLLESSGKANGDSWFRRIMSIYPSGSKLKLKVQESVASLTRGAANSVFPYIGSSRSTYSFNFKVFFGKFRQ